MKYRSRMQQPLPTITNVETYSREIEYKARKIAQTYGSTVAERKALAAAVKSDADRIFKFIVAKNIRAAR